MLPKRLLTVLNISAVPLPGSTVKIEYFDPGAAVFVFTFGCPSQCGHADLSIVPAPARLCRGARGPGALSEHALPVAPGAGGHGARLPAACANVQSRSLADVGAVRRAGAARRGLRHLAARPQALLDPGDVAQRD